MYVYIQVIELQELACRIVMYGPKLFFVVSQKRRCLHKFDYAYFLRVTKLYHVTKFQRLAIPVSEICEFNRKKKKKKKKKKMNNNSKSIYFRFDTFSFDAFSTAQMDPFFNQT